MKPSEEDIRKIAEEISKRIDWSMFDIEANYTNTCSICDTIFRGHSKFHMHMPYMLVSKDPCPECGGYKLRSSKSDIEYY